MTLPFPIDDRYRIHTQKLDVPPRLLLGPGPANVHPRVLAAISLPTLGHLDPRYLELMDEIQTLLRYAWQTDNPMTLSISGTGSAAMEATLANVVEPGDVVLVGVMGYFGHRLIDMASRYGADVQKLTKSWGQVFSLDELRKGLETYRPAVLALVHAETSTGARQPLEGVSKLCHEFDCLLLVDTVTSLGGVPLFLEEWGIDLAYSCSQKSLGCPPGLAPFSMSPRAWDKLQSRRSPVANWYLDMNLLSRYWGSERIYHHTASSNMNYGLRESLRLIAEEGLEARWQRHQLNAQSLWEGLADLGLVCHVEEAFRLPTLTTVRVPEGVDSKAVARQLLTEYNVEIGLGLGELTGKIWRIGLMGYNSQSENIVFLLDALKRIFSS